MWTICLNSLLADHDAVIAEQVVNHVVQQLDDAMTLDGYKQNLDKKSLNILAEMIQETRVKELGVKFEFRLDDADQ